MRSVGCNMLCVYGLCCVYFNLSFFYLRNENHDLFLANVDCETHT